MTQPSFLVSSEDNATTDEVVQESVVEEQTTEQVAEIVAESADTNTDAETQAETIVESLDAEGLELLEAMLIQEGFGEEDSEGSLLTEKVRITKETKIKRLQAKTANLLAKQNGDVLYTKLIDTFGKLKSLRAAIQKKYGAAAKAQVKKYKIS